MTTAHLLGPSTAADLLLGPVPDVAGELGRRLVDSGALEEARSSLSALGDGLWAGAAGELAGMAADFLQLDLAEVGAKAWRSWSELSDAARWTRGTSAAAVVPLGSRTFSVAQHPRIDLSLGTLTVPAVRFELRVDLDVQGVAARVRGGRLTAFEGGRCTLAGCFSAEGRELVKRALEVDPRLALPLGDGLPLARDERAGADGIPAGR